MDGERCGAHLNILWYAHHPSVGVPGVHLPYLRPCQPDDRFVVDHHRHHRHCAHGNWQSARLRRRLGGRSDNLRRLLRRQDLATLRDNHPRLGQSGRAAIQSYTLHAAHHRALDSPRADILRGGRTHYRHHGDAGSSLVHGSPRRTLQHNAVAAHSARSHRRAHRAQDPANRHHLLIDTARCGLRTHLPARGVRPARGTRHHQRRCSRRR